MSEPMLPEALERLRARHLVHYDPSLAERREELLRLLPGSVAWIVRNETRVDREALAVAPRLLVVGRLGSGLDNIDVAELRARNVALLRAKGLNALSVAEWVLAYLFLVSKPLLAADQHVRQGGWQREAFAGRELSGQTLAVVGFGAVGKRLALRARSLGLTVLVHDPHLVPHDATAEAFGVELASLEECLGRADFVSLHVPLTQETRGLIGREALWRMKPGAHLIQTARGGVVDEAALADALRQGVLAGALVDVRATEPPSHPDPLADAPNCLLTPHAAGLAVEARRRVDLWVADAVVAFLADEGLVGAS